MLNSTGTKNSVVMVAKMRPPITARPSGAFCSPPSPKPSAIGSMPITIASAVIMTGRRRTNPCLERGLGRIADLGEFLARKADHQDAVGGSHSHAHDRAGEGGHRQRGMRCK